MFTINQQAHNCFHRLLGTRPCVQTSTELALSGLFVQCYARMIMLTDV